MKKLFILSISLTILLNSCSTFYKIFPPEKYITKEEKTTEAEVTNVGDPLTEHLVTSVLWYQLASEMRASYYQAYNLARFSLDKQLQNLDSNKKYAVVVDIDETLLDNSPFQVNCIETGVEYTKASWKAWTDMAQAEVLPGAVEFLKYAKSKGIETFYISNRKVAEEESTKKNLKQFGFPYVDDAHMLLKTTTSDKTERRNKVKENYEILLLVGDNIGDFDGMFLNRSKNYGFDLIDKHKNDFGTKYIILPNPMYGGWGRVMLKGKKNLTKQEIYNLRKEVLKGFNK